MALSVASGPGTWGAEPGTRGNWGFCLKKSLTARLEVFGKKKPRLQSQYTFDDNFGFKQMLQENTRVLNLALSKQDHDAAFIRSLGIHFEEGKLVVPELDDILRVVDQKVELLPIAENEKLYPARIFQTNDGKFHPVRIGGQVPAGALEVQGILEAQDFASILGQGFFPIGRATTSVNGGYPAFWHDLVGHMGAMLQDPPFMATLRKVNQELADNKTPLAQFGYDPETGSFGKNVDLLARLNHVQETLILTPRSMRPFVEDVLRGVGLNPSSAALTYAQAHQAVARLSDAEIERLIQTLNSRVSELSRETGGTVHDVFHEQAIADRNWSGPIDKTSFSTAKYLGEYINNSHWMGQLTRERKDSILAQYLGHLDQGSRISPSEWLAEVSHPGPIPKEGRVHRYVCESGLFTLSTFHFYPYYCGP